jgi:hypothetical protein
VVWSAKAEEKRKARDDAEAVAGHPLSPRQLKRVKSLPLREEKARQRALSRTDVATTDGGAA